jgi:hypothetical protein
MQGEVAVRHAVYFFAFDAAEGPGRVQWSLLHVSACHLAGQQTNVEKHCVHRQSGATLGEQWCLARPAGQGTGMSQRARQPSWAVRALPPREGTEPAGAHDHSQRQRELTQWKWLWDRLQHAGTSRAEENEARKLLCGCDPGVRGKGREPPSVIGSGCSSSCSGGGR